MCDASCLQTPLDFTRRSIVRRCSENRSTCVPVEKYCNRIADCPRGSDEVDCSCTDLDMHECMINGAKLCIFDEWIKKILIQNKMDKRFRMITYYL